MLFCSDDVLIVARLTEKRNTLDESQPILMEGGLWLWSASEEQLGTLYSSVLFIIVPYGSLWSLSFGAEPAILGYL